MQTPTLVVLIAALSLADGWQLARAQSGPSAASSVPLNEPLHEKFTTKAWAAFQAGQYATAITNADQCIARFGEAADRIEAILESERAMLPTGTLSDADKKRIASYQILHDVATCFLIKGWAEEKLGHKEEAKKAFTAVRKLSQARSSRPTGELFWSPAEKASEHITK